MFQHLYQESESSLNNDFRLKKRGVIVGKVDGQSGGPLNFEEHTLVQNKMPRKKSGMTQD